MYCNVNRTQSIGFATGADDTDDADDADEADEADDADDADDASPPLYTDPGTGYRIARNTRISKIHSSCVDKDCAVVDGTLPTAFSQLSF